MNRHRVRHRPEEALQRQVVSFLHYVSPLATWFHVPSQKGTRKPWELGILKAMGVRAGVADLIFLLPGPPFRGCIELKAGSGKPSPAQVAFREECEALGVPYAICNSLVAVDTVLRQTLRVEYLRDPAGFDVQLGE